MGQQMASFSPQSATVDFHTIIRITYQKNMEIAAARFEIEATDYQFRRFRRSLSQFVPVVVDSRAERVVESALRNGARITDEESQARVSVGFEKEFFDGKKISAGAGFRGTADEDGENANPFLEGELRFPLFGSFTTLERVTELNFEENELLNAWLDFIDTVRDGISDSHEAYVSLQTAIRRRQIAVETVGDFEQLLSDPRIERSGDERRQVEDQIQAFQSETVEQDGNIEVSLIELLDRLGLDQLNLEDIRQMHTEDEGLYGSHYIESDIESVIAEALKNDVEIRVLEIAKRNAELKRSLAERGKWDITGRLFGKYDFDRKGDDPGERSGYEVGVGVSVQRNDPKLLRLSLQQAEAEIRKKLETRVTTPLKAKTLAKVIKELAAIGKFPCVIDEPALTDENVSLSEKIRPVPLKKPTVRQVLDFILNPRGLTWVIQDEVLMVTVLGKHDERLTMRVYPISGLLHPKVKTKSPVLDRCWPKGWC